MSERRIANQRTPWLPSRARGIAAGALVAVVASTAGVDAGSVFMKNGYVIQGPVVERTETSIVLGWENGKLTLHKRFIDQVVYDTGEEEKLEEWERLQEQEATAVREALTHSGVTTDPEALPAELEDLLSRLETPIFPESGPADMTVGSDVSASDVDPEDLIPSDPPVDPIEPADPVEPSDPQPRIEDVRRPDALLGEAVGRSDGAFSVRPPRGWRVRESDGFFEVVAKPIDGQRPSVNVVEVSRDGLSLEDAFAAVRDSSGATLEDWELLTEGEWKSASGLAGVELVGRGSLSGRTLVVRQVLIPAGESYWLCSGFVPVGAADEVASLVDECLRTFAPATVR